MKKIILGLLLTVGISGVSFANDPVEKKTIRNYNKIENNKNKLKNQSESPLTTVSCSITIDGPSGSITYTATAGNWFSSLAGATERCKNKLAHLGHPDNFTIL